MSLASKIAKNKAANPAGGAKKEPKQFENYEIAVQLMKARKKGENAFPSTDIESLTEMALKVVAQNISQFPSLEGVEDQQVL